MKIAACFIHYKAVCPMLRIIDLSDDDWTKFLWGLKCDRRDIVLKYLDHEPYNVREFTWIPLSEHYKDKLSAWVDSIGD